MMLRGFLIRIVLGLIALAAVITFLPGSRYTLGFLIVLVTVISLFRSGRRSRHQ